MIKIIDITLLLDKALDTYCLLEFRSNYSNDKTTFNNIMTKKNVVKLFKEMFDELCNEYSSKYERTYFIVPCFPIMRSIGLSSLQRFSCVNAEYLSENGVSQAQFQEMFEKFLKTICVEEYISNPYSGIYVLNGRYALYNDWLDILIESYGKSLIDNTIDSIFDNNPNFFKRFIPSDSSKVKKLDELELFKMKSAFNNYK